MALKENAGPAHVLAEDVEASQCHSDVKSFSLLKKLGVTDDVGIW